MPDLTAKKKRPLWYNLSPLNLPVPGLVSIFHRTSGLALFLGLLAFLFLLDSSLSSESGFARAAEYLRDPIWKLGLIVSLCALLHHLCACVRHLLLYIELGVGLESASWSALVVCVLSLVWSFFNV